MLLPGVERSRVELPVATQVIRSSTNELSILVAVKRICKQKKNTFALKSLSLHWTEAADVLFILRSSQLKPCQKQVGFKTNRKSQLAVFLKGLEIISNLV